MPNDRNKPGRGPLRVVARSGRVYWVRRVSVAGGALVVYLPDEALDLANLAKGDHLLMWVDNGTVCLRRFSPDDELPLNDAPANARGRSQGQGSAGDAGKGGER